MTPPRCASEMRDILGLRPFSPGFRTISKAIRGLDLDDEEHQAFLDLSGGREPRPGVGFDDVLLVKPRRSGGSEWLSNELFYEARYVPHAVASAPGQILNLPIVCARRDQARELRNYIAGLGALPGMASYVASATNDEVVFTTGVSVRITTADVNAVSGTTACGYGLSELAKWPSDDASEPDHVIIDALDPATAPIAGAPIRRRLRETSAYIEEGVAYDMDREHFGKPDAPTLVLRGSFRLLNPNIDRTWLANEAKKKRPAVMAREYGPDFDTPPVWQPAVTDGWFGDVIERCVDRGRESSEGIEGNLYVAAIDAAFKGDKFALAVAHLERRDGKPVAVLDRVDSWQAPRGAALNVASVVAEVAATLHQYRAIGYADQFSFIPLRELFAQQGVALIEAPWTGTSKPQMFTRVRAGMSNGSVRLCDDQELIAEFHSIQGRLLKSGGERLEARIGHDDLVHASVMALYFAEEMDGVGRAVDAQNQRAAAFNRQPVRERSAWDWASTYERGNGW